MTYRKMFSLFVLLMAFGFMAGAVLNTGTVVAKTLPLPIDCAQSFMQSIAGPAGGSGKANRVTPDPDLCPTSTPLPSPTSMPVLNIGAAADPNLVTWFNSNCIPGDTLITQQIGELSGQTCGERQLLYNSAADAEASLPAIMAGANPPTILGYDFEHRPQTPPGEQADPVGSVRRMRALADRYHIRLLFAPDRSFGQQLANCDPQLSPCVAPLVDSWALQLQLFAGDPVAIHAYADPILDQILAAHPGLRISMQFRSDLTSLQIQDLVNGFSPARRPQIVSLLYTDYHSVIDLANTLR